MSNSRAERFATNLLLCQNRHSLCPEIEAFDFGARIYFDSIQRYCALTGMRLAEIAAAGRDGVVLRREVSGQAVYIILLNDAVQHTGRRRFTMAHEVGHILLGHEQDGPEEEREADVFAAQLLLPRILVEQLVLLWGNTLTAAELAELFGTSRQAACRRLRTLSTPVRYTESDYTLLQRYTGLLPRPDEPIISC